MVRQRIVVYIKDKKLISTDDVNVFVGGEKLCPLLTSGVAAINKERWGEWAVCLPYGSSVFAKLGEEGDALIFKIRHRGGRESIAQLRTRHIDYIIDDSTKKILWGKTTFRF